MDHINKQYCWHASVVNYDAGVALVLKTHGEDEGLLEIVCVPLADIMDQTLELIGTNVNGNPYGDIYTVSHRIEYTPHIYVNILLYHFM